MFFLKEEKETMPDSSQRRYQVRLAKFYNDGSAAPWLRHYLFWLLHNCVAHFCLAWWPTRSTCEFHELTSRWLNHTITLEAPTYKPKGLEYRHELLLSYKLPQIQKKWWWLFHNAIVHMIIGFLPAKWTFRLHDWSAEKMGVTDWV